MKRFFYVNNQLELREFEPYYSMRGFPRTVEFVPILQEGEKCARMPDGTLEIVSYPPAPPPPHNLTYPHHKDDHAKS